ncbi:MAG: 4Fe-4S binding protein, partial [Spirochaetales bacterium]|nr:4Fe-4S binding protein [Spirochaetales bacterium]MCF7939394.1 4Fe-4S binding protein [Spirochaetales bacterium]
MKERAIYTEATQCRDCYKCVRECPVKAIRIENSRAAIDHDLCIFCGRCVDVCPAGAKRVRSDLLHARELVRGQRPVYVSLAPSFPAFFQDEPKALVERFRALGVDGVSETAIGADMVARQEQEQLEELYGPRLSSACPVVVELVRKYHQPLLD